MYSTRIQGNTNNSIKFLSSSVKIILAKTKLRLVLRFIFNLFNCSFQWVFGCEKTFYHRERIFTLDVPKTMICKNSDKSFYRIEVSQN